MKNNEEITIQKWIDEVINGTKGFKSMEYHEFIAYKDRDISIAEFVIRCLANPQCEGSEYVIDRIIERRDEIK